MYAEYVIYVMPFPFPFPTEVDHFHPIGEISGDENFENCIFINKI